MAAIVRNAAAPGGALAVAARGRLVDVQGFGFADVAARVPVGRDTMFALASCSEPITAMAIMKLVDGRKITLQTPAFVFLGMRTVVDGRAGRITIEELLNNSSGLPHDVAAPDVSRRRRRCVLDRRAAISRRGCSSGRVVA